MFNELTKNLTSDERLQLKKIVDALYGFDDDIDYSMIIGALQRKVLKYSEFYGVIGTKEEQNLRSLYDKMYGPFVEWLDEMIKPECVEAAKWPFEKRHERIQKMYNLEMEAA